MKIDLLTEEQQDVLRSKGNKIEKLESGRSFFAIKKKKDETNVKKKPDITQLSKPLLQAEGSLHWSKHVSPGTLAIFQDEKSWNGISSIDLKRRKTGKEFKDVNGLSWNTMKDSMQLESEGKKNKKKKKVLCY